MLRKTKQKQSSGFNVTLEAASVIRPVSHNPLALHQLFPRTSDRQLGRDDVQSVTRTAGLFLKVSVFIFDQLALSRQKEPKWDWAETEVEGESLKGATDNNLKKTSYLTEGIRLQSLEEPRSEHHKLAATAPHQWGELHPNFLVTLAFCRHSDEDCWGFFLVCRQLKTKHSWNNQLNSQISGMLHVSFFFFLNW